MSNIQRGASNPNNTSQTQSNTNMEPFYASCTGGEGCNRTSGHKEIDQPALFEQEHDTGHPATPKKPKQSAKREKRPIRESKSSIEPPSSSCRVTTPEDRAPSSSARSSSPGTPPSQTTPNTVKDTISQFLELTASLRSARKGIPKPVLGKRRGFVDDEDTWKMKTPCKRPRIEDRDYSLGYHAAQTADWRSISSEETTNLSNSRGYLLLSAYQADMSAVVDSECDILSVAPLHRRSLIANQTDDLSTQDLSILPFSWKEGECDPLTDTISSSLSVRLYDTAWAVLREYKDLAMRESTGASEARDRLYHAWTKWTEARDEPPSLLWLYHTGQGLDIAGRHAIAKAMNIATTDDIVHAVRKWIEGAPDAISQVHTPANGPPKKAEECLEGVNRGRHMVLGLTPRERVGNDGLPGWAQSCFYSNSSDRLKESLAQQPKPLRKKKEAQILKKLFDQDGNELASNDKKGRKTLISEGTNAYHLLPDDQKMVLLDGRSEVEALSSSKREKEFIVVCRLGFSIEEGKRFVYKQSACGCLLATKDDAIRHIKEHHFGLLRRQNKKRK
ncbi:hypothetical protein FRC18_007188 [Serendipita sp. 400]|nr:hypothetical protein FRC18_007188 [Serendipita sp. 400]